LPASFANPLGFLALLAIPVILAIHLLREKSRRVPVSTLFLLERLAPRTPHGQRIHRLQNSLPLWLQLLIALLCTWLLVQPRWLRADSVQRITVILDATASMSVCRERVLTELPRVFGEFARAAGRTDWTITTTEQPETPLYRGAELSQATAALSQWQPALPHHDPARAFNLALLEARGGVVLFVTDRQAESFPAGLTLLAFGVPIDNCGFAGVKTWTDRDGAHWQALVKNAGATPETRQWWFETDTTRSQPQTLQLAPGEIATIPGPFPKGENRLTVHLSADRFAVDDVLPLVAPAPKPLGVLVNAPENVSRFFDRIIATVPGAHRTADVTKADVVVTNAGDAAALGPALSAIVIAGAAPAGAKAVTGAITADRHPWTDGLLWEGLLSPGPAALAREPADVPLVWQGREPLVFLRTGGAARQLFLNFDFVNSNADRLPATVLLLGRFLGSVQDAKSAPFAENFETNQSLPLAFSAGLKIESETPMPAVRVGASLRAPTLPGFFSVLQGETTMLDAAAHFGDPREADFRTALTTATAMDRAATVQRENTVGDRFAPLWLVAIGAALAGSWAAQARRSTLP
jgi:hypothetical protein